MVAAGEGRRLGGELRKQYLPLAGKPLLLRALMPFLDHPAVAQVVVVIPAGDLTDPPGWLAATGVGLAAGGAERGDSVRAGLAALSPQIETVLVHDGARPMVTPELIGRVIEGARRRATVPALPLAETVKQVDADGKVTSTPERDLLRLVQTPQGFPRRGLERAYRRALADQLAATDDAALYERYVGPVFTVEGEPGNLKITTPSDLTVAEALAGKS